MVVILLMLLPVAAVLIVWSAFDNIRFDFSFAIQDSKVHYVSQLTIQNFISLSLKLNLTHFSDGP